MPCKPRRNGFSAGVHAFSVLSNGACSFVGHTVLAVRCSERNVLAPYPPRCSLCSTPSPASPVPPMPPRTTMPSVWYMPSLWCTEANDRSGRSLPGKHHRCPLDARRQVSPGTRQHTPSVLSSTAIPPRSLSCAYITLSPLSDRSLRCLMHLCAHSSNLILQLIFEARPS